MYDKQHGKRPTYGIYFNGLKSGIMDNKSITFGLSNLHHQSDQLNPSEEMHKTSSTLATLINVFNLESFLHVKILLRY